MSCWLPPSVGGQQPILAASTGFLAGLLPQMCPAIYRRACRLIREFEREARTDGMPANELNFRKKQYVQELNGFIGLKKAYSGASGQRSELMDGSKSETEKLSSAWRSGLLLCLLSSSCVLLGIRSARNCSVDWGCVVTRPSPSAQHLQA